EFSSVLYARSHRTYLDLYLKGLLGTVKAYLSGKRKAVVRLSYGTDSTMFTLSLIRGKDQAYRMERSHSTFRNDRLRQARIGRNWRQHDLAEELGTTVVTVKRWERGYQQPSPYFRVKLCALFGTSAEQLGLVEEDS